MHKNSQEVMSASASRIHLASCLGTQKFDVLIEILAVMNLIWSLFERGTCYQTVSVHAEVMLLARGNWFAEIIAEEFFSTA